MVNLPVVRACNSALFAESPITAVVVGGASGIGEFVVRQIAATHGKSGRGLRLYIVGRNEEAAKSIIASCEAVCPSGEFRFIKAKDLSLLRDVDRVCKEITGVESEQAVKGSWNGRVDLLVMTQALFAFGKGLEHRLTEEGLERSLSLLYYSRMRFIIQLLPLLTNSLIHGGGRVVSVFGGREQKLIRDDLALRKPQNFSFTTLGSHAALMTTFFLERLAAAHPGKLSLSHYFPGIVLTPAYTMETVPGWFRALFGIMKPLVSVASVSPPQCGQRVLFHTSARFPARETPGAEAAATKQKLQLARSSDEIVGGGAYRTNWNGETNQIAKAYDKLDRKQVSKQVWEHTMDVFEQISAVGKFSGKG